MSILITCIIVINVLLLIIYNFGIMNINIILISSINIFAIFSQLCIDITNII